MASDKMDQIDGKYLFHYSIPAYKPKGKAGKILHGMGYVSRDYLDDREKELLRAANEHIFNTVIKDRKALLDKLIRDIDAIPKSLEDSAQHSREELDRLRSQYEEIRNRMGAKEADNSRNASQISSQLQSIKSRERDLDSKEIQISEKVSKLEAEIRRLTEENNKLMQTPTEPKKYRFIEKAKDLSQEEIDRLMGEGYQLITKFPDLDGTLGEYYVLVKGSEQPTHAALRYLIFYELEERKQNPSTTYGIRPDVEYQTKRGASVGVEVLTEADVKKKEGTLQKIESNKKLYGSLIAVAAEENILPYQGFGFDQVISYREFRKYLL